MLVQQVGAGILHDSDVIAAILIPDAEQDYIATLQRHRDRQTHKAFSSKVLLKVRETTG
jgi:hypothetical protein